MPHFSRLLIIGILAAVISASVQARESCTVDHCHDGDTCTLDCTGESVKVRLHCIDAPEMAQVPWGAQSWNYLRERAFLRKVTHAGPKSAIDRSAQRQRYSPEALWISYP